MTKSITNIISFAKNELAMESKKFRVKNILTQKDSVSKKATLQMSMLACIGLMVFSAIILGKISRINSYEQTQAHEEVNSTIVEFAEDTIPTEQALISLDAESTETLVSTPEVIASSESTEVVEPSSEVSTETIQEETTLQTSISSTSTIEASTEASTVQEPPAYEKVVSDTLSTLNAQFSSLGLSVIAIDKGDYIQLAFSNGETVATIDGWGSTSQYDITGYKIYK